MMISERIALLEQFVAEEPTDPFNHYMLALELLKTDQVKASEVFDFLMKKFPAYVPTYYQAAMLKINLSQIHEAVCIIENGIKEAALQKNQKTVNELRTLLDECE
ncbi:MAG: tetratricopeptide repeat protein [Bacteroidetes bacterium]|nr:tetratricopeptide repeat protein [Bacteroidota bacterium]MBS1541955.1 tetratricopeptide repeat protein [Bacteroidota bacterium]